MPGKRLSSRFAIASLLLGLAAGATAQFNAGDVIVADLQPALWRIEPNRQLSSIAIRVSPPFVPHDLTPGPGQADVLLGFSGFGGGNGYGAITPGGSTIIYRSSPAQPRWLVDVTGDGRVVLAPVGGGTIEEVVLRSPSIPITALSADLRGAALDVVSGDLIAIDAGNRTVLRIVRRTGAVTTVVTGLPFVPTSGPPAGLHFDPTTQTMLACFGSAVYRVGLTAGSITTVLRGVPFTTLGNPDYEPSSGLFLIPNAASPAAIFGFDARTSTVTTVRAMPAGSLPVAVAASASRNLIASGPVTPGSSVPLRLVVANEPNVFFAIALSFGHGAGIPVGGGRRVYLVPDTLFQLSVLNTGIFSGLQGVLDANGTAQGTIALPNIGALSGLRIFAAALTIANGAPSTVTETIGITIR